MTATLRAEPQILAAIYASPSCQTPAWEARLADDMRRRTRAEGCMASLPSGPGHSCAGASARARSIARGEATNAKIIGALVAPMTVAQIAAAAGLQAPCVRRSVDRLAAAGAVTFELTQMGRLRVLIVSPAAGQTSDLQARGRE